MKLGTAVAALGLSLASVAGAQESTLRTQVQELWKDTVDHRYILSEQTIEKELGKWDPETAQAIRDVQFRVDQGDFQVAAHLSLSGVYDPSTHTILIPYKQLSETDLYGIFLQGAMLLGVNPWRIWSDETLLGVLLSDIITHQMETPEKINNIAGAIDHETTHALIEGELGLKARPDYAHPTEEQAREFAKQKLSDPASQNVIRQTFMTYLGIDFRGVIKRHETLENFITHQFDIDPEYQRIMGEAQLGIESPEIIMGESDKFLQGEMKRPANTWRERYYLQTLKIAETTFEELDKRGELILLYEFFDYEGTRWSGSLFKNMPQLLLKQAKHGGQTHYQIDYYRAYDLAIHNGLPKSELPKLVIDTHEEKLQDILISEVHARLFDSLLSLSPQEDNYTWRTGEEDHAYIRQFTLSGKPIASKGLEKRALAEIMEQDGLDPWAIKKVLEYATTFSYKDRTYTWPESGADIVFDPSEGNPKKLTLF